MLLASLCWLQHTIPFIQDTRRLLHTPGVSLFDALRPAFFGHPRRCRCRGYSNSGEVGLEAGVVNEAADKAAQAVVDGVVVVVKAESSSSCLQSETPHGDHLSPLTRPPVFDKLVVGKGVVCWEMTWRVRARTG